MRARPYCACERSVGVLVVFELDHRVVLLEPFNTPHKGKFARSPAFNAWRAFALMLVKVMWRCNIGGTGILRGFRRVAGRSWRGPTSAGRRRAIPPAA